MIGTSIMRELVYFYQILSWKLIDFWRIKTIFIKITWSNCIALCAFFFDLTKAHFYNKVINIIKTKQAQSQCSPITCSKLTIETVEQIVKKYVSMTSFWCLNS